MCETVVSSASVSDSIGALLQLGNEVEIGVCSCEDSRVVQCFIGLHVLTSATTGDSDLRYVRLNVQWCQYYHPDFTAMIRAWVFGNVDGELVLWRN